MGRSDDIALVLSGGGAKGAYEAGVILALEQLGIRPRILAGTSAGAMNAAALACGISAEDIVALWSSLESRHVWRLRKDVHRLFRPAHFLAHPARIVGAGNWTTSEHLLDSLGWTWLLDQEPLRDIVVDMLGGEVLPVEDGRVLSVSCVDVGSGELVRFTSDPTPRESDEVDRVVQMTVDHVLASAAIPGLFKPIEIDGEQYWDGGLIANTPLRGALAHEPSTAIVVATGAVDHDAGVPQSLGQVVGLIVDHLLRFAVVEDLDHAQTVNRLVRAAPDATEHKEVEFVTIIPDPHDTSGIGSLLDFEPSMAKDLIDMGRHHAEQALAPLVG